jgi:arabinan endo-1,5-alpha-L-arabinosidase
MAMIPILRPLFADDVDQGDPFALAVPTAAGARFRYYVYVTGPDATSGQAFPVYGSDDLAYWERLGFALQTEVVSSHWAPCVRYVAGLPRPFVMLYSRAVGIGEIGHVGHAIRRADAAMPEGPFVDSGEILTPDLDFAIDADVYRLPDGSLKVAFAMDFVDDEPYGTGIVEADIDEELRQLQSPLSVLARPSHDWHVYDLARVMPWKTIAGIDWSRETVRWHTVEGPVGGLVAPTGNLAYLYSGGCFFGFYAVGAVIADGDSRQDVSDGASNFVVRPHPERGIFGPGHCSWLRTHEGVDYLMLHARFGSAAAPRQMCLVPLDWTADGFPTTELAGAEN